MTRVRTERMWAGDQKIALASASQRTQIYRMRHAVYARELGQHAQNAEGALRDELDDFNTYIVTTVDGEVGGFISVTPPGHRYSIDKYMAREALPFAFNEGLYEIRLLTVAPKHRGRMLATLLMYAALRWVEAQGATRIVALGREEILGLYLGVGLKPTGHTVRSGAVVYHILEGGTEVIRARLASQGAILARLERGVAWHLPVPFHSDYPSCHHGGAFFEAVGEEFDVLERREHIINADVLDAWFPPSPRVLAALRDHLPWLVRTSPPTDCGGLIRTLARVRDLDSSCILPGAGSSDLIFLALTRWLLRKSRVLILDPMYGEYAHVLERVVRCRVDRLPLSRCDGYMLDPARLLERLQSVHYDLAIIVNPNSPTGRHVPRPALEAVLAEVPGRTRIWIDETYVEYAGEDQSLERFAAERENVVICKSMSKVYALSGMRVGYLCATPTIIEDLRSNSPPWAVGLPSQVAAVKALEDPLYYAERWRETHALRTDLSEGLRRQVGLDVLPSVANFVLCHLPEDGPDAEMAVTRARQSNLFVRNVRNMGTHLGSHALRIAVKDANTNWQIIRTLATVVGDEQET